MTKLLLDDEPLIILPQLAVAIGLNESIIVQQLHYWLEKSENVRDGCKWVYNTYADWQKQFPFWSESTVRRIITKLEKMGILASANFNRSKIDKTKWYRIDYNKLAEWTQKTMVVQRKQTPKLNGSSAGDSGSPVLDRTSAVSYGALMSHDGSSAVANRIPMLQGGASTVQDGNGLCSNEAPIVRDDSGSAFDGMSIVLTVPNQRTEGDIACSFLQGEQMAEETADRPVQHGRLGDELTDRPVQHGWVKGKSGDPSIQNRCATEQMACPPIPIGSLADEIAHSSVQHGRPADEVAYLPVSTGRSVDERDCPSVQNERPMDEIHRPSAQNERPTDEIARSSVQTGPSAWSNWSIGALNVNSPIPENTTEITSERNREEKEDGERVRAYKELVRFCEQNGFGAIGGYLREKINVWVDDTSEEVVLEALKIAVENGAKRWVYVETILRDWAEKGYRTVDEVRAARLAFRKQRVNQRSTSSSTAGGRTMRKPIRTEIVPDWLNMDYSQPEEDDFDIEQARRELEERLKKYKEPS
ncbi:DnaD domain-containing protein [Geobacillus subterraneus]|uniref:DnaD domain-containing protein n=1 Tax=Geobacillus subterraneus TaxID=129338 RepID=UPI00160C8E45